MIIHKTYCFDTTIFDNIQSEKARDDKFDPVTVPSQRYKTWYAVLDPRTCFECADNHGRIFDTYDRDLKKPPVHLFCRCQLEQMNAIVAGGATNNGKNGADYWLKYYGGLPDYYISREQLEALGWKEGDRPSQFAPGKMLGGGVYNNDERKLPNKFGRTWREADINYTPGRRNKHRIFWSDDGLIFVSYDHGLTFYEII